jgi:hypothetical protein
VLRRFAADALRLARQDGQHPHDGGRGTLPCSPRGSPWWTCRRPRRHQGRSRGKADVSLGGGHLPGVTEADDGAQALLGDGRADLADRCPDHGGWDVVERVLAPRPGCPVDGVLQRAGDRAVVFGRDEQNGVEPAEVADDRAAQRRPQRRGGRRGSWWRHRHRGPSATRSLLRTGCPSLADWLPDC